MDALAGEWNELLTNSDANSIFLSWEWVSTWLNIHPEKELMVIAVRGSAGELQGVAPYYISDMLFLGFIRYRVLKIVGDAESGAEYPDWIVRKSCAELVTDSIARSLKSLAAMWDCIWMPRVAGWTNAVTRIEAACCRAGLSFRKRRHEFSGFILPKDISTYEKSFTKNRKQQLRRQRKKIFSDGVSFVHCMEEAEIQPFLDKLFELNSQRWNKLGLQGTFERKPKEEAFYREFVPVAFSRGWLVFAGLQDGSELKSLQIGYVYNRRFHQLQEGFDPDYTGGVGNVLRAEIIKYCIESGVEYYDFLGEFTEHKRRWGAEKRYGFDLFIGNGLLKSDLLVRAGFWPSGQYLRFSP